MELIFARVQRVPEPGIPPVLRYYVEESNKLQHMESKSSSYIKSAKIS